MTPAVIVDQAADTRERLLEAARQTLARFGVRRLSLSDVADVAGVSRQTLYRYFPSKQVLLAELTAQDKRHFDEGLRAAVWSVPRKDRRDAALTFIVDFQGQYAPRSLIDLEPAFVLEQLTAALVSQRSSFARHLDTSEQTADLVVRTALSYFLMPTTRADLLRALKAAATACFTE
jgi:AcrR family transcriptional regulator